MIIRRTFWPLRALLLFVAAFVVASCGGSGGTVSQFEGDFAGTWTSNGPDSGTATADISPGGSFTGTEVDTTNNVPGTVNGKLDSNGTFTGTVEVQDQAINATGSFQISQNRNALTGTVTYNAFTFNFTLTRQTP